MVRLNLSISNFRIPADAGQSKTVRSYAPVSLEHVWALRLRPNKLNLWGRLGGIPKHFKGFVVYTMIFDITVDEGFSCNKEKQQLQYNYT